MYSLPIVVARACCRQGMYDHTHNSCNLEQGCMGAWRYTSVFKPHRHTPPLLLQHTVQQTTRCLPVQQEAAGSCWVKGCDALRSTSAVTTLPHTHSLWERGRVQPAHCPTAGTCSHNDYP